MIKRYTLYIDAKPGPSGCPFVPLIGEMERPEGEWVRWEDVEELVSDAGMWLGVVLDHINKVKFAAKAARDTIDEFYLSEGQDESSNSDGLAEPMSINFEEFLRDFCVPEGSDE